MPDRVDFWRGFVAGTLAGMAVAAFSQYDLWRKLTTPTATPAKLIRGGDFREYTESIPLRREAAESAGDPSRLASARTSSPDMPFVLPGGAPGRSAAAEVLESPGHPGEIIDHSNPARPVTPAPRSINLTGTRD